MLSLFAPQNAGKGFPGAAQERTKIAEYPGKKKRVSLPVADLLFLPIFMGT